MAGAWHEVGLCIAAAITDERVVRGVWTSSAPLMTSMGALVSWSSSGRSESAVSARETPR